MAKNKLQPINPEMMAWNSLTIIGLSRLLHFGALAPLAKRSDNLIKDLPAGAFGLDLALNPCIVLIGAGACEFSGL